MTDLHRFDGQVAVINGGTQGLGEATARLMIDRGLTGVVVSGRNRDRGHAIASTFDCDALYVQADLAEPDAPTAVVEAADRKFGRVDVLVNAAATTDRGSVWDTDSDLWDQMLHVNTRAPGLATTAAVKIMRREKIEGSIVNVGSVAGHGGADFLYPYAASKMALQALTRNAAFTLMRHRIRVNLIQPGWMDTPSEHMIQRRYHEADDGWLERAAAAQPFGRLIDTREAARAICFLASAESGLMTGAVVDFDQSVVGAGDAPQPSPGLAWGEPGNGGDQ